MSCLFEMVAFHRLDSDLPLEDKHFLWLGVKGGRQQSNWGGCGGGVCLCVPVCVFSVGGGVGV